MIHIVGHTAIDHISRVPHLPEKNCSTHISDRQIYFGGGAANIAAGIAVLGEEVTLISCTGGDFAGSEYDTWMKKIGVKQQFFVVPHAHTPTAFMFTDEAGDQMTFFDGVRRKHLRHQKLQIFPLFTWQLLIRSLTARLPRKVSSRHSIPARTFSGIPKNSSGLSLPTPTFSLPTSTR
jgi:Sugar kinases, ribokinase family